MSAAQEGAWLLETSKPGCEPMQTANVYVDEARVDWVYPTLICPTQVSFAWSYVAYGEQYQYVVDQNSSPPSNPINPPTTTLTNATVSSLLPSTTYYIHVRAANGPDFTTFCPTWTTSASFVTPSNSLPPATALWLGK